MMQQHEPIHYLNSDDAGYLLLKNVLYSNDKEGLGFYGILRGVCPRTGKFVLTPSFKKDTKSIVKAKWIVGI